MKKKRKELLKKGNLRFGKMQIVIIAFMLLVGVLYLAQRNVPYKTRDFLLEPTEAVSVEEDSAGEDFLQSDPECLILWQDDANGKKGLEMMESVLGQMKISYDTCEGARALEMDFGRYQTFVISMTNFSLLDESLLDIIDRVEEGAGLMILYPPEVNGPLQSVSASLGIQRLGRDYSLVSAIHLTKEFMLGGDSKDYKITDPYESSLQVVLDKSCEIYAQSREEDGGNPVPLIWKKELGEGVVVFDNLGFLEKAYRGFYSASYSLLTDVCAYPVINASVFYLDDFPSPVPQGDSKYIKRDYGMSTADFYTQVWWRDIYNLAEQYGIRYTGLVIEQYSDQVEAPFARNTDIQRYRYFGNMLLDQGGEIGIHGYNHMPLCLIGFDYKEEYDSYRFWESYEDMSASLAEVKGFCEMLYPEEKFQVYVPPSNILSKEGREALKETTDIKAIASLYLSDGDGIAYSQEFEVAEDGIIETPRVISGYLLDDYVQLTAFSELNFHYVNSHFQHPDDTLDEDRGADLGWEELFGRLSDYTKWLYQAAPEIRNLTGTEFAAAVQIYDQLTVQRTCTSEGLVLDLGGFKDEAWIMIRMNEGTPGKVTGGELEQLMDGLYLLQAREKRVEIEIK